MKLTKLLGVFLFLLALAPLHAFADPCPTAAVSMRLVVGTLSSHNVNSCYYAANTGSDSNSGTKSTPWAHLPGMKGCTGNCAAHTPVGGEGFILRGGDTWGASTFGWDWTWSGSSSSPMYVGVDQTWFNSSTCGGAWCRPIFNLGGSGTAGGSYFIFANNGSNPVWTTFDNFEEKGWSCAAMSSGTLNAMISPDAEYTHIYVHGVSYSYPDTSCLINAFGANISDGTDQVAGSLFDYNVVDNSDQSPSPTSHDQVPIGCVVHADTFAYNACIYTYNINGVFNKIYGNLIENMVPGNSGDHCNMSNIQSIFSGETMLAYNNQYTGMGCAGGLILWLEGNSCDSSAKYYAWGNVFWNVDSGSAQIITTATHPDSHPTCGNFYIFNNTAAASNGQQLSGNGEGSPRGTVHLANNHMIGNISLCLGTGVSCSDLGNELIQSAASANANTSPHFDQYNAGEALVYSPVLSSNSTVGAGQNAPAAMGISCTGDFAAACSDTTYLSYNSSNHTVQPRTSTSRGSTSDIGAFQFQFNGTPTAATPVHSPDAGSYSSTQTVTITDSTAGSTVHICTSTSPCTPSTTYTAPVSISSTSYLCSFATASGYNQSATNCGQYIISTPQAAAPTFSPNGGSFASSTSTTFSSTTASPTFLSCVTTTSPTCSPTTAISSASITSNNSYVCAKTQASGYTDSPIACSRVFWIGPIALVSGVNYPQATSTFNCSPTCSVTPADFGPGNLVFIAVQASGLTGSSFIQSITGCGTFATPPVALQKYDSTGGTAISGDYILSSGGVTAPSCLITMTANSPFTAISVYQASTIGSGFSVETIPTSIITSPCTSCSGPTPSVTGTDIVFAFGAPPGSFLSANYPYADVSIDTATNTIFADELNVSSASAMTAIQNNSHPTTMGTIAFVSSGTLAAPTISPAAGTYTSTQTVTLSPPTGATACYTTDGSTPTAPTPGTCSGGTTHTYTGAITVSTTQTIKTISTKASSINSSVVTAAYTINSSSITGVSVSCSPSSITTAQTSSCSATVSGTGTFSSSVTWSAPGGSISSSGVFTPSGPGTITVTARSTQNTSISGTATVVVQIPTPAAAQSFQIVIQ